MATTKPKSNNFELIGFSSLVNEMHLNKELFFRIFQKKGEKSTGWGGLMQRKDG